MACGEDEWVDQTGNVVADPLLASKAGKKCAAKLLSSPRGTFDSEGVVHPSSGDCRSWRCMQLLV